MEVFRHPEDSRCLPDESACEHQLDSDSSDVQSQLSAQQDNNLHYLHSFFSGSSLSSSSISSVCSRSIRASKVSTSTSLKNRKRLLPRSHKRGGRNKPIIIHDSSSGEIHPKKALRLRRTKESLKIAIDENSTPHTRAPGPADALNELCNLQMSFLQSITKGSTKPEKKKKKCKNVIKPNAKSAFPCLSPELPDLPQCISKELSDLIDDLLKIPDTVLIATADNEPPVTFDSKTMGLVDSMAGNLVNTGTEEGERLVNNSTEEITYTACSDTRVEPGDILGLTTTEESEASVSSTEVPGLDASNLTIAIIKMASKASKISQEYVNSARELDRCMNPAPEFGVAKGNVFATLKTVSDFTDDCLVKLVQQKVLVKDLLARYGVLKDNKHGMVGLESSPGLTRKRRIRHRDRTPRKAETDSCRLDPSLALSMLAIHWSGLNQETLGVIIDICKIEKLSGINMLGAILSECSKSRGYTLLQTTEAFTSALKLYACEIQSLISKVALESILLHEQAITWDCNAPDFVQIYPGPTPNGPMLQDVRGYDSTDGNPFIKPREEIDDSRLEAQPDTQVWEVARRTPTSVSAFDPVVTVSKFLDIVAYPLRYIWKIAYGV